MIVQLYSAKHIYENHYEIPKKPLTEVDPADCENLRNQHLSRPKSPGGYESHRSRSAHRGVWEY